MNKKFLTFMLLGIALLTYGCNGNSTSENESISEFVSVESEEHVHNFVATYDDEFHYEECVCGEKQNEEAHNYVRVEENGYNVPTCICGKTGTPEEISNTISVYFSAPASEYWGDKAYCYLWNSQTEGSEEATWPGSEMTFVEVNGYGQNIYTYDVDLSLYDMIIFNNGNGWQSADTSLIGVEDNSGFYLNDDGSLGTYTYVAQ